MDDDSILLKNDSSHALIVTIKNDNETVGTTIVPSGEEFRGDCGKELKSVVVFVSDATQ